jgi:hypothetical protein
MTPRLRLGVFVFLGPLCFAAIEVHSTEFRPLSIEQLSARAALVLHGTVTGKTVQRDAEGRIYTKVDLEVNEAWKGSSQGKHFTLVHAGGVLGEEWSTATGQEEYEVGEEVVAFLVLNHRGEGVTVGLAQGKFHVSADSLSGEKRAHSLFHGHASESKADLDAGGLKRSALPLAELKRKVQETQP